MDPCKIKSVLVCIQKVLVLWACSPENWQTRVLKAVGVRRKSHTKQADLQKLTFGQLETISLME